MSKLYKIGIVDDEILFGKGIAMLIDASEEMEAVFVASNGEEAMNKLSTSDLKLDLILCDLEMPVMDGLQTLEAINNKYPDLKVAILSGHYNEGLIYKTLEKGASAFLPKNIKADELYLTIRNVIDKGFHYNEFIVKLISEKMVSSKHTSTKREAKLTRRELEVLSLICEQKTNKEMATELFLSSRTIEGHRNNLLLKTDSKNTAGLIIYAVENGLFDVHMKNLKWS